MLAQTSKIKNTLQKADSFDFIAACTVEGAQINTNNVATNVFAKGLSGNVTKVDDAMDLADIVTGRKKREALN